MFRIAAILFLGALTAPAWANSPGVQGLVLPPSACQIAHDVPTNYHTTRDSYLQDDMWYLPIGANGKTVLRCPVVMKAGESIDSLRIAYLDPDGRRGNASVKLTLLTTDLSIGTNAKCWFYSNFDGLEASNLTIVTVACQSPFVVAPGMRVTLEVELWRRQASPTIFVGFFGVDFP